MINNRYIASSKKRIGKKYFLPIALIAIVVALCSYSTYAWIIATTQPIENKFKLQELEVHIEEDFENGQSVKKDVYVQNDKDAEAYIRVALVEQITNEDGSIVPNTSNDSYFTYVGLDNNPDWFKGTDGYYYYKKPLKAFDGDVSDDDRTTNLFTTATPKVAGQRVSLTVMSEAIQVNGIGVWGITPKSDGTIGGKN